MSYIIVDHRSTKVLPNSTLNFNQTSVDLNTPINLYVIIKQHRLQNLSVMIDADNSVNTISLYTFSKQQSSIAITGTANTGGPIRTINIQNISIVMNDADPASTTAIKIANALAATEYYDDIVITDDGTTWTVAFTNKQFGPNPDGEFTDDDLKIWNVFFDITIVDNAEQIHTVAELNLTNVQESFQSETYVYKLNILFKPLTDTGEFIDDSQSLHKAILKFNVNSNEFDVNLAGHSTEIDPRYAVTLQNFKQFVTNDWYTAMYESEYQEDATDIELMNRKRKEYILQLFELTGFIGSYRSLLAALEFFGYGELLTLKEYWVDLYANDNGAFKTTDIKNTILSSIDTQLAGFRKSNQMSLVYQINTEKTDDPKTDSADLPYYVNVLYNTEQLLVKLYTLKRILEEQFLPLNTKIIDIQGEYQAITALQMNAWLNELLVTRIDLSEDIRNEIQYEFTDTDISIKNHNVFVEAWSLEEDSATNLQFIAGTASARFTDIYFEVDEISTDERIDADLDVITRFVSTDFAIAQISFAFGDEAEPVDPATVYREYKFIVYDENGNTAYTSRLHDIADIVNGIKIGFRVLGSYTVNVYIFDLYGGYTLLGIPDKIIVSNTFTDFTLYRTIGVSEHLKNVALYSTYPVQTPDVGTEFPADQVIIDGYDQNGNTVPPTPTLQWDPWTGIDKITAQQHLIKEYYAGQYDIHDTYLRVNEMNGIPISDTVGVPISAKGYKYSRAMVDVIGDANYSGMRTLRIKLFDNKPWEDVALMWDGSKSEELFIQQFIELCIVKFGTYSKFTFSMDYFSVDGTSDNMKAILTVKANDLSMLSRLYIIELAEPTSILFDNGIGQADTGIFVPLYANLVLYHNGNLGFDQLTVTYNNTTVIKNVSLSNIDEVIAELNTIRDDNDFDYSILPASTDGNTHNPIRLSSRENITIQHVALGINSDIVRGKDGAQLVTMQSGSDIVITEPVYAFIDTDSKIENHNVNWRLSNSLTNEVIAEQNSLVFRYVILVPGAYSLELTTKDSYGINQRTKKGCFLVTV